MKKINTIKRCRVKQTPKPRVKELKSYKLTIRALELLGTEFSSVGNHDHLLGGKVLGSQIRRANVKTKFVVANLESTPDMELGDTPITGYVTGQCV